MPKIQNDKYYTPKELAKELIDKTFDVLKDDLITEIIEPSAGNGSFSDWLYPYVTAYDIEPEADYIIKQDYLTLNIPYKKGRLVIGNPPFGKNNWDSIRFYKKSVQIADYIAFIQPISQLNNNMTMYEFDLIYSEDLGLKQYSDRKLHCCFNIFKRPKSEKLNSKPDYTLKDVTIIEHRRKKGDYTTGKNKEIKPDYDYAICNWGAGSLGKVPKYIGQYAQEVYFYIHNQKYKQQILDLLSMDKLEEYTKGATTSKKISVMRLYKYLKENIKGIE